MLPVELPQSVHELRRRWKPVKLRLTDRPDCQNTLIRFHRACSWLQQAESLDESALDQHLVLTWIAFNALYGRWDAQRREPCPDGSSLDLFSQRILQLDRDCIIPAVLQENRKLVMALFEDEYLSSWFWEDPTDHRVKAARSTRYKAQTWFVGGQWRMIQDRLIERIYFLRCQLVHGAATCGSRLNRTALRRCSMMLDWFMKAWLTVWIDHGADADWGEMCYPPMTGRP